MLRGRPGPAADRRGVAGDGDPGGPAAPGGRRQSRQAARPRARRADRGRPAAALPAPVRAAGRADRPGLAARRRARDGAGQDRQGDQPPDAQPAGLDLRGDGHRRARAAGPHVLLPGAAGLAGEGARSRAARPVLRPGLHLPGQAPARPPRLRAARRRRRRAQGRRVRRRDHPDLPGRERDHVLADRRRDPDRPRRPGHRGPDAARDQGPPRPVRPGRRAARHPPPDRLGRQGALHAPAEVGRGVPAAGGPRPAAAGRHCLLGDPAPARDGRAPRRL